MLEDTLSRLEAAKLRWMTGGEADVRSDPFTSGTQGVEAQLRLLAQAALFRQTCLRPSAPSKLTMVEPLPAPPLPLLSTHLRPAFRHIMQQQDRSIWQGLTGLMAARGVMAHPFDWLPPQDTNGYADIYIPYAKWKAGLDNHEMELTAETWQDMYPAERRNAFAELRAKDTTAARAMIEAYGSTLSADERLGLIDCLAQGLGADDIPYLTEVSTKDRSAKVKARAAGFLARLGVASDRDEAKELAAFMEKSTKGIIRRRKEIALRSKLNGAQQNRVSALLDTVTFTQLAAALDITPDALADSYVTEKNTTALQFWGLCARTAPRDALLIYWARLRSDGVANFSRLAGITDQLSRDQIMAEAQGLVMSADLTDLHDMLAVTGPDVGRDMSDALLNSPFYRAQLDALKTALAKRATGDGDYRHDPMVAQFGGFVTQLAFLVTAEHARRVASDLQKRGLHAADPILHPLNFNIALQGKTP